MTKFLFITGASLSSFFFGLFGIEWDKIDQRIAQDFAQVEFIAQDDLLRRYNSGQLPVVIDVRNADEYAVSHLPEAVNISAAVDIAASYPDKSAEIVVYCSVGLRSAAVAAELQDLGYQRVRNLRHAVFQWANDGSPLNNADGSTDKVHPFNRAWATLVAPELRSYQPE